MSTNVGVDWKKIRKALDVASLPDLQAILSSFFDQIGGHNKFAEILAENFISKPGPAQTKTLDLVLQALKRIHESNQNQDIALLSDDDLNRMLAEKLNQISNDPIKI